jgi:hypothetical protein
VYAIEPGFPATLVDLPTTASGRVAFNLNHKNVQRYLNKYTGQLSQYKSAAVKNKTLYVYVSVHPILD